MNFPGTLLRCWLPLLFLPCFARPQSGADDSLLRNQAITYAVALHDSAVKDQLALYNGSLYLGYPYSFNEGTPYFIPAVFSPGDLWYDQQHFRHISLLFDNYEDQLIVNLGIDMQLVADKVDSFSIGDQKVVRLVRGAGLETTGFYELLADGKNKLYARQKKKINEVASPYEGLLHSVETSVHFYLKKGDRYIGFSNRNELLEIFADQKLPLKQYIKKNRIVFKNRMASAFADIVSHYNQLTTP